MSTTETHSFIHPFHTRLYPETPITLSPPNYNFPKYDHPQQTWEGKIGILEANTSLTGPCPATEILLSVDHRGVPWLKFGYTKYHVMGEYRIRCDIEAVEVDILSYEFKLDNCVYPQVFKCRNSYQPRRKYQEECNLIGWALAELNVCLRDKSNNGLRQRAVDCWRNTSNDESFWSRETRRKRKAARVAETLAERKAVDDAGLTYSSSWSNDW